MVSEEGKDGAVCSGEDQFSSFAQSCQTLCDSMDCSTPGLPVHHQLPELAQTHMHQVGDTIQPSRPLSSLSPPAFNLSQHQGLFQWVGSLHQVAKILVFQLQRQSFQWIFRTNFLQDWLVWSPCSPRVFSNTAVQKQFSWGGWETLKCSHVIVSTSGSGWGIEAVEWYNMIMF